MVLRPVPPLAETTLMMGTLASDWRTRAAGRSGAGLADAGMTLSSLRRVAVASCFESCCETAPERFAAETCARPICAADAPDAGTTCATGTSNARMSRTAETADAPDAGATCAAGVAAGTFRCFAHTVPATSGTTVRRRAATMHPFRAAMRGMRLVSARLALPTTPL